MFQKNASEQTNVSADILIIFWNNFKTFCQLTIRVGVFNYFLLSGGKNWKYLKKIGRNENLREKLCLACYI